MRDDKWSARLDANTRFGLLSGYYFFDDSTVDDPYPQANVPGFNAATTLRAQQINVSAMTTFGSSKVNEFRANYVRRSLLENQYDGGTGVSLDSLGFVTGADTLGIVGVVDGLESVPTISTHNWTIGTPQGWTIQANNTFQFLDNFTWLKGNHTLKFGAEYHYAQINGRNIYAPNGSFEFDGSETGSDFADFLIGAPGNYIQATLQVLDSRTMYFGAYGQDSWRVSPTFTVNYGLRWEVSPFWWDTQDKIQTIVPGLQSTVFPGAPTGWVFPGDEGIPRTLAPTRYNNFAPRIGAAWSPDKKNGLLGKIFGPAGTFEPPCVVGPLLHVDRRQPVVRRGRRRAVRPLLLQPGAARIRDAVRRSRHRREPRPALPAAAAAAWRYRHRLGCVPADRELHRASTRTTGCRTRTTTACRSSASSRARWCGWRPMSAAWAAVSSPPWRRIQAIRPCASA